MKKIIIIFPLILIIFSTINVLAFEEEQATVIVGNVEVPVYNVETTWGKMEFIYNEQINYEWDLDTHTYELSESTFKWIEKDNYIDIVNKSHMSVDVNLSYDSVNDKVFGNFNQNTATIKTNENVRFTLTLNGKLQNNETEYVKVGHVNLTIK